MSFEQAYNPVLLPLYNAKSQKMQIAASQILLTLRFYLFADLVVDRGGSFERPVQQNNTPGEPGRHYKRKKRCTVVCADKICCFCFRRKHFFYPEAFRKESRNYPCFQGFLSHSKMAENGPRSVPVPLEPGSLKDIASGN